MVRLQAVLDSHLQHRGPDHPNTLLAQGSLASLLHRQGRHAQALPHAQRCLEGQRRTLAPDHPIIAGTWNLNGDILLALGRLDDARNALHACQAGSPLIWKTLSAPAPRKPKIRPGVYTVGGRDEAWIYRQAYLGYWQHAGALAWATGAQPGPARGGEC